MTTLRKTARVSFRNENGAFTSEPKMPFKQGGTDVRVTYYRNPQQKKRGEKCVIKGIVTDVSEKTIRIYDDGTGNYRVNATNGIVSQMTVDREGDDYWKRAGWLDKFVVR